MTGSLLQLKSLGVSISIGIFGGCLYDFYRILFRLLKWRTRWLTAFGDALFWGVFTPAACILLFIGNAGEVRFYTFLGIAGGFFVYYRLFHRYAMLVERRYGTALVRCLHPIRAIFSLPFNCLVRLSRRYRSTSP